MIITKFIYKHHRFVGGWVSNVSVVTAVNLGVLYFGVVGLFLIDCSVVVVVLSVPELPSLHSLISWHMITMTMMSMVSPSRLRHQRKTGKHFGSGTGSPYFEAKCRDGSITRLFRLCLLLVYFLPWINVFYQKSWLMHSFSVLTCSGCTALFAATSLLSPWSPLTT